MQKISIAFLLAVLFAEQAFAAEYEVREEYRQDVIDYDEDAKRFWRQNFAIKLNKTAVASLSHNYVRDNGEHILTGYLNIPNASSKGGIIAGNYNASFGSGLFLGARRYISADPFAATPFPTSRKFLSPSGSSSPVYSLFGLAGFISVGSEDFKFSAGIYSSVRKRYVRRDYYEAGELPLSISSVNGKTKAYGVYREPVQIKDLGFTLGADIVDCFAAGLLLYGEKLESYSGKSLVWEYNKGYFSEKGIRGCGGISAYLRYTDKYIFVFCEAGFSGKREYPKGTSRLTEGYALAAGFRFRCEFAALSLYAADTGPEFYAPEASDSVFPTEECRAALSFSPWKRFRFGGTASYERKKYPGKYEAAPAFSRKDGLFAVLGSRPIEMKGSFDVNERNAASGFKRTMRELLECRYRPSKSLLISAKASCQQRTNTKGSWSAGAGISGELFEWLSAGLDISFYSIGGYGIYAIQLPAENALASSSYIGSTCASSAIRLVFKYKGFRFAARYQQQHTLVSIGESRMEFSGRAVF